MRPVALAAAAVAVLFLVGCSSTHREVRVASLETIAHPVHPKMTKDTVATAVVLTTTGAALASTGAALLICNGGGLGCFGGTPDRTWGRPPSIERTVLPITGLVLFVAGAAALVMAPVWGAIDLSRE